MLLVISRGNDGMHASVLVCLFPGDAAAHSCHLAGAMGKQCTPAAPSCESTGATYMPCNTSRFTPSFCCSKSATHVSIQLSCCTSDTARPPDWADLPDCFLLAFQLSLLLNLAHARLLLRPETAYDMMNAASKLSWSHAFINSDYASELSIPPLTSKPNRSAKCTNGAAM